MREKILTKEQAMLKKRKDFFVKKIIKILIRITTTILIFICAKKLFSTISTLIELESEDVYFLSILMWYGIFAIVYVIMISLAVKISKKGKKYSSQRKK